MTVLDNQDRKILTELQDELFADIQMLEEYFDKIEELLKKQKIEISELDDDIINALQRKKNRNFALLADITALENEYGVNIREHIQTAEDFKTTFKKYL